eukprot:841796-Ditylum_brightwellii.AAC.1
MEAYLKLGGHFTWSEEHDEQEEDEEDGNMNNRRKKVCIADKLEELYHHYLHLDQLTKEQDKNDYDEDNSEKRLEM